MQAILKRIFGNRDIPQDLSPEDQNKFISENFPKWVTEFETSGFLDRTKLPPISSEGEFIQKLQEHKNDLLVIKYWKHGCIPCLSLAEMYKNAEEYYHAESKKREEVDKKDPSSMKGEAPCSVVFYSMDTKAMTNKGHVEFQMILGTPAVLTFRHYKQWGKDIEAMNLKEFMREIDSRRGETQ